MKPIILILMALLTASCTISLDPSGQLNIKGLPATATMPVLATPPATAPRGTMTPAEWTSCKVTGELHLRALPAADAPILDYLEAGQIVVASTGKDGEWRQVHIGELDGWSHGDWLECDP